MNQIEKGELAPEKIVKEGENTIKKISETFKKHEKEIGERLATAIARKNGARESLGKCKKCDGGDLLLRKSKFGGMTVSEAKRLKTLEEENRQLKKLVADLSLDKQALKAVLKKKF